MVGSDMHRQFADAVAASGLSDADKAKWMRFAEVLSGEDKGVLLELLKDAPGALEAMNDEVTLKRQYLDTGDPGVLRHLAMPPEPAAPTENHGA